MTQIRKRKPSTPKQAAMCCGPMDDLLDPDFFKSLSDGTRLKLLGCLAKCGRACSVTELAECCSVDLSVVSRHLAMLERAAVISSIKKGRTVFYAVKYIELCAKLRSLANAIEECDPTLLTRRSPKGDCCGR
jgi:ArsR family transcriptional regulator, arsenate/arsenite/antimonite-responsive transcriptional repressor